MTSFNSGRSIGNWYINICVLLLQYQTGSGNIRIQKGICNRIKLQRVLILQLQCRMLTLFTHLMALGLPHSFKWWLFNSSQRGQLLQFGCRVIVNNQVNRKRLKSLKFPTRGTFYSYCVNLLWQFLISLHENLRMQLFSIKISLISLFSFLMLPPITVPQ